MGKRVVVPGSLVGRRRTQVVDEQPFYNPERDGVTVSLLSTFKECRERTRLGLNGWTKDSETLALVFGTIVHGVFERMYGDVQRRALKPPITADVVKAYLTDIERRWHADNPRASAKAIEMMELTLALSEATLPAYFTYWKKDFTDLKWVSLEHEFRIPIEVDCPDGVLRQTFLRGKMDGVYRLGNKSQPWLFETKTKSRIEEGVLADVMPYELQVNTYLYALMKLHDMVPAGVLYNIIRRPGLRQKSGESVKTFADRCIEDVRSRLDWYFLRMEMTVDKVDIDRFEGEMYDLVGDFLAWWAGGVGHYRNSAACENKYGTCPMIGICSRRDYTGFYQRTTVFRELEEI